LTRQQHPAGGPKEVYWDKRKGSKPTADKAVLGKLGLSPGHRVLISIQGYENPECWIYVDIPSKSMVKKR
jgi:hypothetical protein